MFLKKIKNIASNNTVISIAVFSVFFSLGLHLLFEGDLTAEAFVSYFGVLIISFFVFFFRAKISKITVLGNELQLIQEAKSDIREYLLDTYKVQLLSIAGNKSMQLNIGSSMANNVDTLLEIYKKLKKQNLLHEAQTELQTATKQVLYEQANLLSTYAAVNIFDEQEVFLNNLEERIAKVEKEKSFEEATENLKSSNISIEQAKTFYEEAMQHFKSIKEILIATAT